MFTGFSEDTIRFFLDIRFHNEVSWFHAEHDRYIRDVQTPFYELIEELGPTMRLIDPEMEIRPHRCLSRIHRDTRFSKDKSPYRDHLWFLFRKEAEPRDGSVFFWFGLEVGSADWGVGIWNENRTITDRLRRQIVAEPSGVKKLIDQCKLQANGMRLSGTQFRRIEVPNGVPAELAPWYRARQLYIEKQNPPYQLIYGTELKKQLEHDYLALAPIYRLLRGCILNGE